MTLKDFSFKQLDKSARLEVGKFEKQNEKVNMGRGKCAMARTCSTR